MNLGPRPILIRVVLLPPTRIVGNVARSLALVHVAIYMTSLTDASPYAMDSYRKRLLLHPACFR